MRAKRSYKRLHIMGGRHIRGNCQVGRYCSSLKNLLDLELETLTSQRHLNTILMGDIATRNK
jgi:hypothetical protein